MEYIDPASGELVDLETTRGLQTALKLLGYDPGTVDGVSGPRTVEALKRFQKASGLGADGVYGPKSKQRLVEAVAAKLSE